MVIEVHLMRVWARIVESVALFANTILAIGLIMSAVKSSDAASYLGTILCVVILLPAIMASDWCSMFRWRHLGIVGLSIMIAFFFRKLGSMRNKR